MYAYQDYDKQLLNERIEQFRDQTERYLDAKLSAQEYRILRLPNGLYEQRYAPMIRIAVPYGMFNTAQLRMLAQVVREHDKGYCHVTTRTDIQINWPSIGETYAIQKKLARVDMHCIQTSGNDVRNITSDELAGVNPHELEDPRPWCELVRQWSTLNPEFMYLPRKFKIAINADPLHDKPMIGMHDIGIQLVHDEDGDTCFDIWAGGGLGRTPMLGKRIGEAIPWPYLLAYLEAILRVYNKYGFRDNKWKARIKILVNALGVTKFRAKVDAEFAELKKTPIIVTDDEVERLKSFFTPPAYDDLAEMPALLAQSLLDNADFSRWYHTNTHPHAHGGYRAVTLTLKKTGRAPGDVSDEELEEIAALADHYSFGQVRGTHQQNLLLADIRKDQLFELWQRLTPLGFAVPNLKMVTDIVSCPGGDFCSLANAKTLPIAEEIQRRFSDLDRVHDLGPIDINMSGCMNACGQHHVGHIGVLGVDKHGREYYQITLGGRGDTQTRIGKKLGPSLEPDEIVDAVEAVVNLFVKQRLTGEVFIDTVERIGIKPFKECIYGNNN